MAPNRENSKRSAQERKKTWQPPSQLQTPPPRPGIKYRWVRRLIRNEEDVKNVMGRLRQGYEPVQSTEIDETFDKITEGRHSGTVAVGDLMLMEVPEEIVEQRTKYFDDLTDRLQSAVDQELMRNNSRVMPIEKESKTETEFGRADREVSFQKDKES